MISLGAIQRQRRSPGLLALAAMSFYIVLLPWHIVSQATTPLLNAKSFEPPCHDASVVGDNPNTPQPARPRTHCPICNGFAAFHLAVPAPASAVLVRPAVHAAIPHTAEDDIVNVTARAPQSRGPPNSST